MMLTCLSMLLLLLMRQMLPKHPKQLMRRASFEINQQNEMVKEKVRETRKSMCFSFSFHCCSKLSLSKAENICRCLRFSLMFV